MREFEVIDSLGNVTTVNADYWENYEGSVDFAIRDGGRSRVVAFFYKPVSITEVER